MPGFITHVGLVHAISTEPLVSTANFNEYKEHLSHFTFS